MTRLRGLLAVVATALGYYFGAGLDPIAPLIWIAPLPVLLLGREFSIRQRAGLGFLGYCLGGLNTVSFLSRLAPLPMVAAAVVVPALLFGAAVLAHHGAGARWRPAVAMVAFPVTWTAAEFVLARLSPDGTALNLGYSQVTVLPLLQVASVTGIWGLSFLVTLLPAGLATAWAARDKPRAARAAVGAAVGTFALAAALGWLRIARTEPGPIITAGAAATDSTVSSFDATTPEAAMPVVDGYRRRITALAGQGAEIVVLPEKFVGVTPESEPAVLEQFERIARELGVTVIGGLNRIGRTPPRNSAFVFGPSGEAILEYDKAFPVPAVEAEYSRGQIPGLFTHGGATVGVAICKDLDFPWWLRRYAVGGARIVFVPAWDFVVDGRLHARMAIVRGVEGGFAIVRSAQEGWVTVSDHLGRVLAAAATRDAPETLIAAKVPLGPGRTPYALTGDWFGWLNVAALILLAIAFRRPAETSLDRRE